MNKERKRELEAKGFEVTTVADFLGLSKHEEAIIELRLALSQELKKRRIGARISQERFAKRLETSQARVAKMEAGDKSVSLDLLIRNLLKIGVSRKELAEIVSS
ncbi:MAG: helix-turn-helix transcriptional regulator [Pyrinomonadaceae bacterium]